MDSLLKNKSVLVTGASGFLGGHLIEKLLLKGARVVGLVHDFKKNSYINIEGLDKKIDVCRGDINNLNQMTQIMAVYEIEYVFHCAANPIVKTCSNDPVGCFQTNIMGTTMVLEACRRVGHVKGVLCMESDKSYGSFDINDLPYKEDQALKPSNVYEVSKACTGFIARAYNHNYNIPTFTIRGANLYGPGDMNLSRLVPGSMLRILNDEEPFLYEGVANYTREFLYVVDAAKAIISLMEQINKVKGLPINLGSGDKHEIGEFMNQICHVMNSKKKVRIEKKDFVFKEIKEQWLDLTRMKELLPNLKFTNVTEGLKQTADWYTKFHNTKRQ